MAAYFAKKVRYCDKWSKTEGSSMRIFRVSSLKANVKNSFNLKFYVGLLAKV